MADAFTGEVRMFGFTFPPLNWANCDGSLLPIRANTQLFSILGTNFGGNGTTTFALPDLRNNAVLGMGTAVSGTTYELGETGGETVVALTSANTPAHTHGWQGEAGRGVVAQFNTPGPTSVLATASGCSPYFPPSYSATFVKMDQNAVSPFGNASPVPHANMMPTIAVPFCICTSGIFPPRS